MFWTEQRITDHASQSEQRKSTLLSAVFSSVLLGTCASGLAGVFWSFPFFVPTHPSKYQYNSTADGNIPPSSPFVITEGVMPSCALYSSTLCIFCPTPLFFFFFKHLPVKYRKFR